MRSKYYSILALVFIAFFINVSPTLGQEPPLNAGKDSLAIKGKTAAQKSNRGAPYFFKRGLAYFNKNIIDSAIMDFNSAITLDPSRAKYYYNLGLVYMTIEDFDSALQDFNMAILRALEIKEVAFEYINSRALAYAKKKNYESAIADYNILAKNSPDDYMVFNNRGEMYRALGNTNEAMKDFNKAANISDTVAIIFVNRGLLYNTMGLYDQAIGDFSKAIGFRSNVPDYYVNRGSFYEKAMDPLSAIKDYSKALSYSPGNPVYLNLRGIAQTKAGQLDVALADFENAIRTASVDRGKSLDNRGLASYYVNRALVYTQKKQYPLALQDYNKAIELRPLDSLYLLRSKVYSNLLETDSALADCDKAITDNDKNTEAYFVRAELRKKKGRLGDAVTDYNRTIHLSDTCVRCYVNLINLHVRMHAFIVAARVYNTFQEKNSNAANSLKQTTYIRKYFDAVSKSLPKNNFKEAWTNVTEAENQFVNSFYGNQMEENDLSLILALKGYLQESQGQIKDAFETYKKSLEGNNLQEDIKQSLSAIIKKHPEFESSLNPISIKITEPVLLNNQYYINKGEVGNILKITGRVQAPNGIKRLVVNDKIPIKTDASGYFEYQVTLKEYTDHYILTATDNLNQNASTNVSVQVKKTETIKTGELPEGEDQTTFEGLQNARYYAILIAEKNYADKFYKTLPGTVADVKNMYNVLNSMYGFSKSNIDTFVNVSRSKILEHIRKKASMLNDSASLLIVFAGHGALEPYPNNKDEAFFVPVDAEHNATSTYISGSDIKKTLAFSNSRHILLLTDVCYAGALMRGDVTEIERTVASAYREKSRRILSSGNKETVPDNSKFMEILINLLKDNKLDYLTAETLYENIKAKAKADQEMTTTPQYERIDDPNDLGGHFVFKLVTNKLPGVKRE